MAKLCSVFLACEPFSLDLLDTSLQQVDKKKWQFLWSWNDECTFSLMQIKLSSVQLARKYMKRVAVELDALSGPEKEPNREFLVLQGVRFAFRVHQVQSWLQECHFLLSVLIPSFTRKRINLCLCFQFAGGFDAESMKAFEELRSRVATQTTGEVKQEEWLSISRACLLLSVYFIILVLEYRKQHSYCTFSLPEIQRCIDYSNHLSKRKFMNFSTVLVHQRALEARKEENLRAWSFLLLHGYNKTSFDKLGSYDLALKLRGQKNGASLITCLNQQLRSPSKLQ